MSFANIPDELKQLPQWCVWRYVDIGTDKPTKEPFFTKEWHASVTNPKTWLTFNQAAALSNDGFDGIGFILTSNDPYFLIDLDDTKGDAVKLKIQQDIYNDFDTYNEISPSGRGLHLIGKGSVPAGLKRNSIEIYSSFRYVTFTGNVHTNKPIKDCQDKLTQLWSMLAKNIPNTNISFEDQIEKFTDDAIIKIAMNAANGDKFSKLYNGNWQEVYPEIAAAGRGPSEADFALIDMFAFYTQNRAQIARLFYSSVLGKRPKVQRIDYVNHMIGRSFDRMPPIIDFDEIKNQLELKLATISPVAQALPPMQQVDAPPGLLGELASFIYAAAPRPVPEIALAGAIGLMAGIVGRAYNVSNTGLNHYVLVLTKTGRGKEAAASGIDKLINAVRLMCPTVSRFRGPAIISSGQALIRHLASVSNCFVSVLGEFGITIERISNRRAVPSDKMLYQMLLDLYNKSGHGQTLQASAYSKKENDVAGTNSPALTIFGESTHKIFYEALNEDMIAAGLLPRFLIIDYEGDRVLLNEQHEFAKPDKGMIERFASLIAHVETITNNNQVVRIERTPEAIKMLRDFDEYTTQLINKEKNDVVEELWNRAHMKVLRLAGLVAVGLNHLYPVITAENVQYAMKLVQNDIKLLSDKFRSGMIGVNSEEIKQRSEAIRCLIEYTSKSWEQIKSYCPTCEDMHKEKIVPHEYFTLKISPLAVFKNDRIGKYNATRRVIQSLIDDGKLEEVTKLKWFQDKFNRQSKRAFLIKPEILD